MKLSDAAVNARAALLGSMLDGGYLRLYSGRQPIGPEMPVGGQIKLAELRFGDPAFKAAVSGMITANPIAPDKKAAATGKATWFRCFASDGTTAILDGSVGTAGCEMNLNSVAIQENAEVSLASFVHDEND